MPKHFRLGQANSRITVEDDYFAGGGEGNLHKIVAPSEMRNLVAKFYHAHKLSPLREEKINFLIANPPHESVQATSETSPVVWIVDALYTDDAKREFVGFVMPMIKGEKLEILCMGKLSSKLSADWQRFDFRNPQAFNLRLRLGFNLAAAIYQVHSSDRYVLVDLKPENVIVKPNGILSLVDTDSVEVLDAHGNAIYPAPVATPEYTPAEYYKYKRTEGETVGEAWDRFGLAVILYKLLFGIHPFAASNNAPYEGLVSLHEKIEHGLFVHAPSKQKYMKVIPPPHNAWSKLTPELQALFVQCFEQGHDAPELRPTAEEWCVQLLNTFGDEKLKQHFASLLFRHSNMAGRFLALPSAKIELPRISMQRDQWNPADAQGVGVFMPPALSTHNVDLSAVPMTPPNGVLYGASWGLFVALLVFMLVVEADLRSWLFANLMHDNALISIIITLVLVAIPQIVLPWIFTATKFLKDPKKAKLVQAALDAKRQYEQLTQEVQKLQARFSQILSTKLTGSYDDFVKEMGEAIQALKQLLSDKDEAVRQLQKQQQDELLALQQNYLQQAQNHAFIKQFKGNTLEEIREKLELEEQLQLSQHKQKMQRLNTDKTLSGLYKAEQARLEAKLQSELADLRRQADAQKQQLEQEKAAERQRISGSVDADANIANHIQARVVIPAQNRQKLLDFFAANQLTSILQIEKVDVVNASLLLKGGQTLRLADAIPSPITAVSLIMAWWSSLQQQAQNLNVALDNLEKTYAQKLDTVEKEYEVNAKRAEVRNKNEIQSAALDIIDAEYKLNLRQDLKQYADAKLLLDGWLAEYNLKNQSILDRVNADHEAILTDCDQQAARLKQRIELQELQHQERLKQLATDSEYANLQKGLQDKSNDIAIAVNAYSAAETELLVK